MARGGDKALGGAAYANEPLMSPAKCLLLTFIRAFFFAYFAVIASDVLAASVVIGLALMMSVTMAEPPYFFNGSRATHINADADCRSRLQRGPLTLLILCNRCRVRQLYSGLHCPNAGACARPSYARVRFRNCEIGGVDRPRAIRHTECQTVSGAATSAHEVNHIRKVRRSLYGARPAQTTRRTAGQTQLSFDYNKKIPLTSRTGEALSNVLTV
ncbi:hypothetical protein EVAR_17760_1 [Eumeta japonica]|uniref:Uncharacterized protein n=1 Tax=Eumeta variegata TaxID=151549 RepID=A0A4C1TTP1_EUMVA|nr:hypothetical protein EVAR_17760_1 [Eumeta japonica]